MGFGYEIFDTKLIQSRVCLCQSNTYAKFILAMLAIPTIIKKNKQCDMPQSLH